MLRCCLQPLHCHHATGCAPRRAPHRSLQVSGDFPTLVSTLGAPSASCADHTHPRGVKAIACIVTCSSPLSLACSTPASSPMSPIVNPCAALPAEQTRSHPGRLLLMTPPKGLHQSSPSSTITLLPRRSQTAELLSTPPLAARPEHTPEGMPRSACATTATLHPSRSRGSTKAIHVPHVAEMPHRHKPQLWES